MYDGAEFGVTRPVAVRLLNQHRFTPPRAVEVEHDGQWCPGFQHAWRLLDDGRGWIADVEYVVQYHWDVARMYVKCRRSGFTCDDREQGSQPPGPGESVAQ